MFLRALNNIEKELVLGLAIHAVNADKKIEEKEKMCLELYADELGINLSDASKLSVIDICKQLKEKSDEKQINKIVFEIAALMLVDFEYDENEKEFMNTLIDELGVSSSKLEKMIDYIREYMNVVNKINVLLEK